MTQFYTATDHFVLVPAILLALFGIATLLFDFWVFPQPRQRKYLIVFVALGVAFTAAAFWRQHEFLARTGLDSILAFDGALVIDGFALFFNWVFLAASLLVALVSYRYLEIEGEHRGEYYGLILLANCGMYLLAAGADLITLFVGLELMALCFYVMVGFLRDDRRSNEAAIKYLLLGAFSSGFLVYGFSVLYGISGSTKLAEVASAIASRPSSDPLLILALVTTAVGLLFKVSAAPFHMWAPDAYEGAPTTVTAYLSVASKAASFALLVRIFGTTFASARDAWQPALAAVAVVSLTVGNLAAITQTNLKRLLAYSSISHAGYILLGLVAGNETGIQGVLVYILVYAFMNLGAFLVLVALRRMNLLGEQMEDISGLVHKSPGYAYLMLIFLLSLAGIPPTAGFIAKYFIFLSLIQTGHYVLAVIAALYVAVAVYYYFRIVRSMFTGPLPDTVPLASTPALQFALGVTAFMTLAVGLYPQPFVSLAENSILR